MIATTFQMLQSSFRTQDINGIIADVARCNRKSEFQDGGTSGVGIRHLEFTDFRLHRTVSAPVPFGFRTPKT